jgi:hypothetical protein
VSKSSSFSPPQGATATTPLKGRQAWRQYLAKFTEYNWIGYHELEEHKRSWWQRWPLRRRRNDYSDEKQALLNFYWWLQIVIERQKGELPVWEGIRIVRERKPL